MTAPIAPKIAFGYTGDRYGWVADLESLSMRLPMLQVCNAYNQKNRSLITLLYALIHARVSRGRADLWLIARLQIL